MRKNIILQKLVGDIIDFIISLLMPYYCCYYWSILLLSFIITFQVFDDNYIL